jgi:hypothetical protein
MPKLGSSAPNPSFDTLHAVKLSGLPSNKFDSSVAVPISIH